jgi:hypothetical protein
MASIQIWEGDGAACVNGLEGQCGGCRENQCPAPHRMAAHRRRAPYNMGGFFDPSCDEKNVDCYAQLVDDDVVWLALIPEDSLFSAVRVKVEVADAANVLTFDVVAELINADTCEVLSAIVLPVTLAGLSAAALDAVYAALAAPVYTDPYAAGPVRQAVRVGLQLTAIPGVPPSALNFKGRILLTAIASDFETVGIPNCRDGRCVINNP